MVIITTSTRVPLFIILPNLRFHTFWVEAEVIIHAIRVRAPVQCLLRQSNSVWDVFILLQIPQLRREIALHCQLNKSSSIDPCPETPPISNNMDELAALCLLGQIWGDYMPPPAIIHKIKSDWRFLKG